MDQIPTPPAATVNSHACLHAYSRRPVACKMAAPVLVNKAMGGAPPAACCKSLIGHQCDGTSDMLQVLQRLVSSSEYALRMADGRLYTERLIPSPQAEPRPIALRADMSHIISGGARGLGLTYAQHLIAAGGKCIVLMGRNPLLSKQQLVDVASSGAAVFTVR